MMPREENPFVKLQRAGLFAYHASIVVMACVLVYGCFLLWAALLKAGQPLLMILLTLGGAIMAGIANAAAALAMVREFRANAPRVTIRFPALLLGLLSVLAASALFSGF